MGWGWWEARRLARRGLRLDRLRLATAEGTPFEVVQPAWWNLKRWWVYFHCRGTVEIMLPTHDGRFRYYKLRVRTVQPPPSMPITLKDGKRITPQPPPMDRLARRADIERSIPDAVLERYGVTRRDV